MSEHSAAAFFDVWHTYRKVVAANYMHHMDIRAHIERVFAMTKGHKGRACQILGISRPTLERKLRKYGFDPGTWRAPQINNPETNLFAKLDVELSTNSHLEVSGTSVNVNQDKMIHTYRSGFVQPPSLSNARDGYELSGSGYYMKDETRTLRGKWTATLGNRFSNELIVGRTSIADNRPPVSNHPLILVGGNSSGTYIAAGAERCLAQHPVQGLSLQNAHRARAAPRSPSTPSWARMTVPEG